MHKARELPREEFKREVEKHLTGQETEPWEIIYFKLYKSQLPVLERALETAALMLGSDKSRGYCLEMICADFLAGANLEESTDRQMTKLREKSPRLRLDPRMLSGPTSLGFGTRRVALPIVWFTARV